MIRDAFFSILGLFLMIVVYKNVKKRLFSEKESFFWIILSFITMISPLFIPLLNYFSSKIGILYPPSLLFIFIFLFVHFLIFRISKQLFIQNNKINELSQQIAILKKINEEKLFEMESK